MRQREFLALTDKLRAKLEQVCSEERLRYKYLGTLNPFYPHEQFFVIGNELYGLYNDGDTAFWEAKGYYRGPL